MLKFGSDTFTLQPEKDVGYTYDLFPVVLGKLRQKGYKVIGTNVSIYEL